jgi:hypothetical protein
MKKKSFEEWFTLRPGDTIEISYSYNVRGSVESKFKLVSLYESAVFDSMRKEGLTKQEIFIGQAFYTYLTDRHSYEYNKTVFLNLLLLLSDRKGYEHWFPLRDLVFSITLDESELGTIEDLVREFIVKYTNLKEGSRLFATKPTIVSRRSA